MGAGSFHGLKKLHTLLLNDNHIRRLPLGAFEGAPNLRILYLYKNRLEHIAPGAFAGLPRLEQLYLHHNHLREIRPGTFNDLPALERLFLHSNKLHRLPADAFVNVGPMTRLRLDSNALICDCNLVWLVERLRDRPTEMAAICQSPHKMKGRSLATMLPEDFHCSWVRVEHAPFVFSFLPLKSCRCDSPNDNSASDPHRDTEMTFFYMTRLRRGRCAELRVQLSYDAWPSPLSHKGSTCLSLARKLLNRNSHSINKILTNYSITLELVSLFIYWTERYR